MSLSKSTAVDHSQHAITFRFWLLLASLLVTCGNLGCARVVANLVHAIQGNDTPAEFEGLKGKRVAVVCATDEGIGSDANGILLSRYVRELLEIKIDKIDLVSQEEIDKWSLGANEGRNDYTDIGQGVKADYLIAIEMLNMSLQDGATLFQGKSDLSLAVYDMNKSGKVVFRRNVPQYTFPSLQGASALETDETKFRKIYLTRVANRLARYFYPYEIGADVAADVGMLAY